MVHHRIERLNSLLKEVISDVIKQVRNPHLLALVTVTRVDISKDLHHAKVYVSLIGSETERQESLAALNSAAGFIAVHASKEVRMRFFPELIFKLDDSAEKHQRIDTLLQDLASERETRPLSPDIAHAD